MKTLILLLAAAAPYVARAQEVTVPLTPDAWLATDSIRFETHLDRPSVWINRGEALVKGASLQDGSLDLDMALGSRSNFMGVAFRAVTAQFSNVIFLRGGSSGTTDAVQYGPAFNSLGVAWQVYHGEGANAVAIVPRNQWLHVRIVLAGDTARLYVDTATAPTLIVPRVVTSGGTSLGIWTGAFGRGAWFSNIRYTPAATPVPVSNPAPPANTITNWELSDALEVGDFTPASLPDLSHQRWQRVEIEPQGWVLVNRYRAAPVGGTPTDSTGRALVDSIMTGKMAGERIVYARTIINADRDEIRRLQYTYCNGVVVYLNGRPLAFNMNPSGLRSDALASMPPAGDAVYLPLHRGRNELVFAVVELTGGWAFAAKLDPR